jgi:ribokinase
MAVYNFGSVNIDHVYQVDHFVQPGETLSSTAYAQLLGGKGANQSVALAKAGANVFHVGHMSQSDTGFKQQIADFGVDCRFLRTSSTPSGHAIIQVSPEGENAIVLFGGANQLLSDDDITTPLQDATSSDWILLQNETNALEQIILAAAEAGTKIAFNPAPMTDSVKSLPLDKIDLLIVNEIEAEMLTGESDLEAMVDFFTANHPNQDVIITLGKEGVCMLHKGATIRVNAFVVDAVDTTAAGDTFIGFFLAAFSNGLPANEALTHACAASAISVTRSGAAQSIPSVEDVKVFLANK